MKKILLFATASVFCFQLMAQDTKTQSSAKTRPTKQIVKTPDGQMKTVVTNAPATTGTTTPATASAAQQTSPDAVIKVNTDSHDFGKIKQGTPVVYSFEITNISKKPVVVENTYASCGCTTPEKIVEPIAPGATAKLKVQYSAAAMGQFTKDVHIKLAGVDQEKLVRITGEVVTDPAPAATEAKPNN